MKWDYNIHVKKYFGIFSKKKESATILIPNDYFSVIYTTDHGNNCSREGIRFNSGWEI